MIVEPYYFQSIRKVCAAFGTLFNNIHIQRTDEPGGAGNLVQLIKVPLAWGPKQKYLTLRQQKTPRREEGSINIKRQSPRMSYEMTNLVYDSSRKLNAVGINSSVIRGSNADVNALKKQLNPVPYDVGFDLHVLFKNMDDGLQILEQITPMFQPQFNVTIVDVPELDIHRDVPIILANVNLVDEWDGDFTQERETSWTLSFVAKTHIYPTIRDASIIKRVISNVIDSRNGKTDPDVTITTEVDPFSAGRNDDWTVKETIEQFDEQ